MSALFRSSEMREVVSTVAGPEVLGSIWAGLMASTILGAATTAAITTAAITTTAAMAPLRECFFCKGFT